MDINVAKEIFSLGNMITAIPLLFLGMWYFEKKFSKLEIKHDEEMANLRNEHIEIIKSLKTEHQDSLKAQRDAHAQEREKFFSRLNDTLSNLIKEIQISNDVRSQISHDIDEMKIYQSEIRRAIEFFKQEQSTIKATLMHNGEILSALLQCDLNGKGARHELKRELEAFMKEEM